MSDTTRLQDPGEPTREREPSGKPERLDMPRRGTMENFPAAQPDVIDVAIAEARTADDPDAGIAALRKQLAEEKTAKERERDAREYAEQRATYGDIVRAHEISKRAMD